MKFLGLPDDASPRLKALHIAQASLIMLTIFATFLTAVVPAKRTKFTFGLLYSLIFTAVTNTILLRREQVAASKGLLTKDKYVKYQLFKMLSAVGLYIVGFILWMASCPSGHGDQLPISNGLWLGGVKINRYRGWILWMHFFNWVFMWASLFYSCCMTANKQGPIALTGEEANIGVDNTTSDEEYARQLQAEDPNWQG
ncbi:hypothetical protein CC86DRAFT_300205 [Ophiobolus disseminans]|uniref:Uncharacterized protein n=1 Tax=Ophiobolus disseminans TaxID=1469910 RepID=A0A6A6ZQF1_9PLEO|nr:hypothetical protein CC86DRAFT_300205 [Ophiobolus disseminans]